MSLPRKFIVISQQEPLAIAWWDMAYKALRVIFLLWLWNDDDDDNDNNDNNNDNDDANDDDYTFVAHSLVLKLMAIQWLILGITR